MTKILTSNEIPKGNCNSNYTKMWQIFENFKVLIVSQCEYIVQISNGIPIFIKNDLVLMPQAPLNESYFYKNFCIYPMVVHCNVL